MSLHLQPVQVATGSNDTESHLVFAEGFFVAEGQKVCSQAASWTRIYDWVG